MDAKTITECEDLLAANDPAYLQSIAKSRAEAAKGDLFSIEEVFGK